MIKKKAFYRRVAITGILYLLFKTGYGQEPDTWYTYTNVDFGFAVEFPEKPDSSGQMVNTEAGPLVMHMFQVDRAKDDSTKNIYYVVNYAQYPESVNPVALQTDTFYRNSIKGMLANLQSDLLEEKVIYQYGYEGRELRIDFQKGLGIITEKLILAGKRYYILMVVTENENDGNPCIRKFLDSFRLLGDLPVTK